ncbi:hypothetical protein LZC95_03265 [Pendulispora brunnea]|uniref:Uncharacterized protein n=1 Tax=Pendulispora brunnea TaxID=2905690 RepID=A0ABZ2KG24_9BACT
MRGPHSPLVTPRLLGRFVEPMWDPPHAPYLGPNSRTCSFAQQRAARAVRALLVDGNVREELAHVPSSMPEAALVSACLVEDRRGARSAIRRMLKRHEGTGMPGDVTTIDVLAIDALGALRLLMSRGIVDVEDLGTPTWYFPFRLAFAM